MPVLLTYDMPVRSEKNTLEYKLFCVPVCLRHESMPVQFLWGMPVSSETASILAWDIFGYATVSGFNVYWHANVLFHNAGLSCQPGFSPRGLEHEGIFAEEGMKKEKRARTRERE